eukprot:262788-Amphidinium_carterae.1
MPSAVTKVSTDCHSQRVRYGNACSMSLSSFSSLIALVMLKGRYFNSAQVHVAMPSSKPI